MIKALLVSTACLSFALSGCATLEGFGPDRRTPDIASEIGNINAPGTWTMGPDVDQQIAQSWQQIITDGRLLALIDEGLAHNRSLSASALNIKRSAALLEETQTGDDWIFTYNGTGSGSTPLEDADVSERLNGNLSADWEWDLWGRIDADIEGARFDFEGAKAFYEAARQSLTAQIARSYISAIDARLQLELTQETLDAQLETARIVEARYEFGEASRRERVLSQSDVANARDSLVVAQANLRANIRSLEVLLGRYPSGTLDIPGAFPSVRSAAAAGQPAEILRRRPDILVAEYDVLAAYENEFVTRARTWPSLGISGGFSLGGSFEGFLDPANMALDLGARLADEIFDGGEDQPLVRAAEAISEQRLITYGAAVLDAYAEVENALDDIILADQRYRFVEQEAEAARETLRLAEIQYKAGDLDLLDVLTFRQRSFQADSRLISIRRLALDSRIALYLALGGGAV